MKKVSFTCWFVQTAATKKFKTLKAAEKYAKKLKEKGLVPDEDFFWVYKESVDGITVFSQDINI